LSTADGRAVIDTAWGDSWGNMPLGEREISQLIKGAPVLTATDTVTRAVGLMRAADTSSILVLNGGSKFARLTERAVAAHLGAADDREAALTAPIGPLTEPDVLFLNQHMTLRQAAQAFASHPADLLPVLDDSGAYRGVVYRRDVVALMTDNLRPPVVGGMATPLGVYLTTGSHRAGAGSLGLFLTGMALMTMVAVSVLLVHGLSLLVTKITGVRIDIYLNSPPVTVRPNVYDLAYYGSYLLANLFFLGILKYSPLAGYHAAEHMTVHAIEAGESLTPKNVERMSRIHPRCGTNLLAAVGLFLTMITYFRGEASILIAMVLVLLWWRSLGALLQRYVTTRPPSPKQLANGISAGKEIVERYQEAPEKVSVGFERVWNLGYLQAMAGMITASTVFYYVQQYTGLPVLP